MTRQTTEGARRWLHLGRVCAGCDHVLRGAPSTAAAPASKPKFTACPARGLAAGYDPRTQVAPGTTFTGFFTRDWQAKRSAA
ncbi:hypothetical protein [Azohydromonas lata]|uniref:hypothetical protein n=1 Tax=Azohydromonas lata TaxID=45677 RepID=UPI00082E17EB|nr:hypothetical protein [Azohydromonas lata]